MQIKKMILEDEDIRTSILSDSDNIVVTASAGTGKTFTIINKIAKILETKKNFKKIVAITFSKKAAAEIKDRLKNSANTTLRYDSVLTGTMHSWAVSEIIEPFYSDYYPLKNDMPITPYFGNQRPPVTTYEEGIQTFRDSGFLMPYIRQRPRYGENSNFRYGNDGYDFIFDFAFDILQKSSAAKKYIMTAYTTIFIDEYQDVNKSQHKLISYIVNSLNIQLCIFGDNKQELYGFRGANPDFLNSFIQDTKFKHYELTHNFRSSRDIVDYANSFAHDTSTVTLANLTDVQIEQSDKLVPIIKHLRQTFKDESILILFASRKRRENDRFELIKNSDPIFNDFFIENELAYSESDNAGILTELVKIIFGNSTLYNLSPFIETTKIHQKFDDLNYTINLIKENDQYLETNLYLLINIINSIYIKQIDQPDTQFLLDTITNREQLESIIQTKNPLKLLTIHGAKGLEADNVIIFGNDFFWQGGFKPELHYVAITRAKRKLIVLDSGNQYINMLNSKPNVL
ncbi:UvrD-helicase domain-containing protein [Leuconostoc gasicomitatum]|jgi:superfamily I DNA/RNA helicase|uniref:UvrD-helicase domain-containing protein n=1 Tax=Leuconostoc gasicomitatum TaxID=115778 RepID=UPI000744CF22|nr:ATP-dependent helicase [Leuconostoc gasicomitatum]MBZ5972423.1 ATP-dependent helicase [Leuconostoc gasicomitatum]CUR64573.1 Putative helicase [Leuconostoc gasicomitatum KG16-1]